MCRISLFVALAILNCAGLVCVVGWVVQDTGRPDAPLQWLCRNHTPVVGLHSTYDGRTRTVSMLCVSPSQVSSSFQPSSSTYITSHRRDTITGCANTSVISGVHLTGGGEVVIACSHLPAGLSLDYCSWSRWLNRPTENVTVPTLPHPWLVRSIISREVVEVQEEQSDWRYKLELCQLTTPSSHLDTQSCQVPSLPHGRVGGISHTHSITKNNTRFKIKTSLICDPGYYWNRNNAIAVCENGTWTKFPACSVCGVIEYCNQTVCTNGTDAKCLRCLPTLPDGLPLVVSRSGRRCRAVPAITTGPPSVGFVAGSNLTLDCEVRGRPTPSMSWHRVLTNGDRVPLLDHTHFVRHGNGSMTIVNINDMDSGPYVCRAWNAAGSDIVYIHVYNSHPDGTGPPSIYFWSPLHVVSPSPEHPITPSHLHCHARGFPPPRVTWSRLNLTFSQQSTFQPILSPTISQYRNGTLQFQPVQTKDTALYRCEASNIFGTVTMETIFFVDTSVAGEGPLISQWSANHTVPVGDDLLIPCTVSSTHSTTHLLWMEKGGRVPMSDTRVWQNGNGNLVFRNVSAEDTGPYWCVAWDQVGVAMEMTELIVTDHERTTTSTTAGTRSLHMNHLQISIVTVMLIVTYYVIV